MARKALVDMAREGHRKGWWSIYEDVLPSGFDILAQCTGLLDERLACAFASVEGPALLIGLPAVYLGLLAALGAPKWLYVPCAALLVLSYLVQYAALRRKNTKQG